MIRAFAAIALPEAARFELMLVQQGLPLPRPVPAENLHLTLVFLGELPEPVLADVDLAFAAVRVAAFDVTLQGTGIFGGARPRVVYVGVRDAEPLRHLQAKLAAAARGAGAALEARRFTPHVTLARLRDGVEDRTRLERAVASRPALPLATFRAEDFRLYRSRLGSGHPAYAELARYALL